MLFQVVVTSQRVSLHNVRASFFLHQVCKGNVPHDIKALVSWMKAPTVQLTSFELVYRLIQESLWTKKLPKDIHSQLQTLPGRWEQSLGNPSGGFVTYASVIQGADRQITAFAHNPPTSASPSRPHIRSLPQHSDSSSRSPSVSRHHPGSPEINGTGTVLSEPDLTHYIATQPG